eukprot:UN18262
MWEKVTITMKKPPQSIDFTDSPDYVREDITSETVLYDGPTRAVCAHYPRNVNSHAATALAGIGFDRTRSILIADPALDVSVIELSARGQGCGHRPSPCQSHAGCQRRNDPVIEPGQHLPSRGTWCGLAHLLGENNDEKKDNRRSSSKTKRRS